MPSPAPHAATATVTARRRPPAELDRPTLARAKGGDRRAQRALIDRYERPVFAVIARVLGGLGGRAMVEDLAQDTFLRVLRALPNFDLGSPARPSSWILTIARRRAIDELRRRRLVLDDVADATAAASMAGVESHAERGILARRLAEAIHALSPEHREVIVLRELEERSYDEIAAGLGLSVGTVKSRLSRARAALRAGLTPAPRTPAPSPARPPKTYVPSTMFSAASGRSSSVP